MYKSEDKIHIVPISDRVDNKDDKNINNVTLNKSDKKVHFKSTLSTSKKIKALATIVLGTMASSFNTMINNHTIKLVGITNEIPGPVPDAHVLETKLGMIDEFGLAKNSSNCSLLIHANLSMKRELQFMDIVNDEKDEDISFVPNVILNGMIWRTLKVIDSFKR